MANKSALLPSQKTLWLIQNIEGAAKQAYNEPLIYRLEGSLSIEGLRAAATSVVMRHDALRCAFVQNDKGDLYQHSIDKVEIDFRVCEMPGEEAAKESVAKLLSESFDLGCHHPIKIQVVRFAPNAYYLAIVLHHIITDGASSVILVRELCDIYNDVIAENTSARAFTPDSYLQYVDREIEKYATDQYQNKVGKLADALIGYQGLNLATKVAAPHNDGFRGDSVLVSLPGELTKRVKLFAKEHNATIFHVLISAYIALLSRYAKSNDVAVAVPFANRLSHESKHIIGCLINTLPIRVNLGNEDSFEDLIKQVKQSSLRTFSLQNAAYSHVVDKLPEQKGRINDPLLQCLFAWAQDAENVALTLDKVASQTVDNITAKTAKFNLSLYLGEKDGKISGRMEFKISLFDRQMIENFMLSFEALLDSAVTSSLNKITALNMLHPSVKQQIHNQYYKAVPSRELIKSLGELFSDTAFQFASRCAVVSGEHKLSYAELDQRSNDWAGHIRSYYQDIHGQSLSSGAKIGLCISRNEDMIIGILGILKAGAAYVPIDPQFPEERINHIVTDSQMALVLTHSAFKSCFAALLPVNWLMCMDTMALPKGSSMTSAVVNIDAAAYLLYTSGSTGKPKGVEISHRNVICLFESLSQMIDVSEHDVWSLFHTYCFDISVWEIWGAFLFGGKLVVVPYETTKDPKEFYQLVRSENVTIMSQTASAFQMFIAEDAKYLDQLTHLRYVGFVGESLKVSMLRPWVQKYTADNPQLINLYGITETTVYTNFKRVTYADIESNKDNIGKPLPDYNMFVMDEALQWCPPGVVGELYIAGNGLAKGYFNNPSMTDEKYINDPYVDYLGIEEPRKLYKTGDLGRWLENGDIEYLGRKDFQVKLRGFRIELGEIEAVVGSYHDIAHSLVVVEGEGDKAKLIAYYIEAPHKTIDVAMLKGHISRFLPRYMVPQQFICCKAFPMTANGKVDRGALKALAHSSMDKEVGVKMPVGNLEEQMAEIWAELLSVDKSIVGRHSNFFELGGNSLLVVRMLSMLSTQLQLSNFSIGEFIAMPQISFLSSLADGKTQGTGDSAELLIRLQQDLVLDKNVMPVDGEALSFDAEIPRSILLTGATGFLGSHMLAMLLEHTQGKVYCVVRGETTVQGWQRINDTLQKYHLGKWVDSSRVEVVLGDLMEAQLGIDSDICHQLENEVDAIYHVGAWVHHIYDYRTLHAANVGSTVSLLRLATANKNKSFHFISTLNTQIINPMDALEKSANSHQMAIHLNGYLLTKWVGEQLIYEAKKRGVKAHIYRPGNIVCGDAGVCDPENNHALMRLKGYIQLGKAPWSDDALEMMPVDQLAQKITSLSLSGDKMDCNLHNPQPLKWTEYVKMAAQIGYEIEFVQDANHWQQLLGTLDESNALYKIALFYKRDDASQMLDESETNQVLKSDIDWIEPYPKMVQKQLYGLREIGFLPAPTSADK